MTSKALILLAFLSFIYSSVSYADETPSLLPRCGQTDFGLCGYIDAEAWETKGQTVFRIDAIFERAEKFSEGLAAVRIEGKYGYIDPSGKVVIEPQFDSAGEFNHGIAIAGVEERLGVIDLNGDYAVEPIFGHALVLRDDTVLAVPYENESQAWTDTLRYSIDHAGIYHLADGWLTESIYSYERFNDEQNDLIWAQVPGGRPGTFDGLYGLMRANGTWLIEPQFTFVSELKDNRAPVRIRLDGQTVSGAVNGDGQVVVPFVYDYLTSWEDGFLLAGEGEYSVRKFGLINPQGELLAGRYFDVIERRSRVFGADHPEQNFFSVKDGDEWKTLLKDGTLLTDQRIGTVFLDCDKFQILYDANGYTLKPKDTSLTMVSFDRPLFPYTNRRCDPPPTLIRGETYAKILENGSVFGGFFENSSGFFGPHRWVRVDGKWGLVNADGSFVVEPIYDAISAEQLGSVFRKLPSENTSATYRVTIGDEDYRLRFFDGEYLQEPFVELEEDKLQKLACRGGFKRKSTNGLWGIVSENGEYLIEPQYRAISCFNSGVAWVPDDDKKQWCPIDTSGNKRSAPACRATYYSSWASHSSPEEFDKDPYESNVLWMRAWLDYGEGRRDQEPRLIPWQRTE